MLMVIMPMVIMLLWSLLVAPHYYTTLYVTENNSLYNETQLSPFSRAKPNQHPMPYATD